MEHKSELEKEFELERVILFSDAVFAIAITLLIIDIKWPELPEDIRSINLLKTFKPTFFQAFSFMISFFFIGLSWAKHLNLFRHLRKYDKGLIVRNLFFLFFIVVFPFAAAGMPGKVRHGFMVPLFVYFFNLGFVNLMHFLICRYIFYQKPGLSMAGEEAEKKYIYIRAKYAAISILLMTTLLLVADLVIPNNDDLMSYSACAVVVAIAYANRKAKKYKPVTPTPH
ncbi:MAG TPA: TMEM175 family protein [Puia sp.]|jgi:uncharacterized membrane protein|nr:TMEM175 family protein [Puia sp.]